MQATQQTLIYFFEQVAQKNNAQLTNLRKNKDFILDSECWRFTLPNLYSHLKDLNDDFNSLSYQQFRQLIFNSPINQTVKLNGAEIIISDNQTKVDQSNYALVWG
ncbi:MAG: hypothetical protein ACRBDX_10620 [Gammaproteobacteria bacterium]